MKDGMRKTLGKTISSIVVGNSERNPKIQVFLVFDDETYFEFWGPQFSCACGVDCGGIQEVSAYIEKCGGKVTAVYSG